MTRLELAVELLKGPSGWPDEEGIVSAFDAAERIIAEESKRSGKDWTKVCEDSEFWCMKCHSRIRGLPADGSPCPVCAAPLTPPK